MNEKQWDKINKFEQKLKKRFLCRLTESEGIKILDDLYKFVSPFTGNLNYKKIGLRKTLILAKVHSMFMKVK